MISSMKKMGSLFWRVFLYTGVSYWVFLFVLATKTSLTYPVSTLACNVRTNWSDYDPLVYPVYCTSKLQYFLAVMWPDPLSITIWLFLSFVIFFVALIYTSLRYKPTIENRY